MTVNKIGILAYNFPHKKTQDFIFRILAEGYNIETIYAAEAVKLNIPHSTIKTKINHLGLIHPSKIAQNLGIRYKVISHNSEELHQDVKERGIEIGIISGARILSEETISCFNKGVINFHPGIIPQARGLDALLWSIYKNEPIGVTAHLVDKKIDAGAILEIREMPVYLTDTILDLSERLYEIQLDMIPEAIERTVYKRTIELDNYGSYNRKMPAEIEAEVTSALVGYLKNYGR